MGEATSGRLRLIHETLAELNEWESQYGITYGDGAGLGTSGEAPARIESLKDELRGLGAVFRWDGASYVLVDTVSAGEGYQVEDV